MRTIDVDLGAESAHVHLDLGTERRRRRVDYRAGGPWGLTRWVDPSDGAAYVLFSGALGGAADLLGEAGRPDDLTRTTLTVRVSGDVPGPTPISVVPAAGSVLAGHHLGFAVGPWRHEAADGVAIHARRSCDAALRTPLAETRAALDWMLDFFGGDAPWGSEYVQVLVPDAPWLAMEHPGCVLLSERLLTADRARRVAALAHEAAHQWLGNLVAPASWADLGVFEGLAELLGQLACRDLLGSAADAYLDHRRRPARLARVPGVDPRGLAETAGLAEVAGPTQHAELFRAARHGLAADVFRGRLNELVRTRAGLATSAAQVWAALGTEPREPVQVRLPAAAGTGGETWTRELRGLRQVDPATAVVRARRAFRSAPAGQGRVEHALAALADPSLPTAVAVGLAAELAGAGQVSR
ncbi:M1 family aminopeptidase [Micromonospora sp. SL4-19]|uniref:M1 family aminopeptidase n=1 Tax=Micromonospora sp. SL4-19 TaxID=3399129 RepID=UPI003A4D77DA